MSWKTGIGVALSLVLVMCYNATATNEIIITSISLKPYAEQLALMHESMRIDSKVVTVEEIWKNYTPSNDPPIYGCANKTLEDITGYNYTLAKKIIAFLRTQIKQAKYVTIFGDSDVVPPSYYFDFKLFAGVTETPTDFFYASPDYDMKPDFAVGRIPVNDASEAQTYIDKLKEYYANFTIDSFRNALFFGGKSQACPGRTDCYSIDDVEVWQNEISIADLMWKNVIVKFNSTVLMQSDGLSRNEARSEFNKAFSGGYGVVFHSQHGTAFGIQIVGPMYTKRDLAYLTKKISVLPIFISEGCEVAAYDTELAPGIYMGYPPRDKSFAEYLLIIKAGAIASIGAARDSLIDEEFEITNGFVNFTKFDYMHVITSRILEDIGEVPTLGEAFKDALTYYSEKYNLAPKTPKDKKEKWIYQVILETVLLGDPTLKLPKLEEIDVNPPKVNILSEPEKYVKVFSDYSYRYYNYPYYVRDIKFEFDGNVTVKVFNLSDLIVPLIERKVVNGYYTFKPEHYGKYLIRLSNGESETWYVFYAEPAPNHPPIVEDIRNVNVSVGENLVIHINASDPDGDEITCKPIEIPEGAKIVNFTFYWTPEEQGDYMVKFVVSDDRGGSTEGNFTIYVVNVNTDVNINVAPIYPPDGATNIPLSPTLRVKVEGARNYTTEFYNGNGSLIGVSRNGSIVWRNLKPGTEYEWYVIVKDDFGDVKSNVWKFTTSYAPIADFKYTITGRNVTFTFTGYDPDEDEVKCYWDFGDGSKAVGCNIIHTYSKDGEYDVTLTVVDETNVSSSVTKKIIIKTERAGPPMSKDLDGDGLYEDINGDGKFDYSDIVYFQWNFNKPEFQKYKEYYDFYPDGKLNYRDVLNLYVYWKWGVKRW
mgnify:CR=1 FL=1